MPENIVSVRIDPNTGEKATGRRKARSSRSSQEDAPGTATGTGALGDGRSRARHRSAHLRPPVTCSDPEQDKAQPIDAHCWPRWSRWWSTAVTTWRTGQRAARSRGSTCSRAAIARDRSPGNRRISHAVPAAAAGTAAQTARTARQAMQAFEVFHPRLVRAPGARRRAAATHPPATGRRDPGTGGDASADRHMPWRQSAVELHYSGDDGRCGRHCCSSPAIPRLNRSSTDAGTAIHRAIRFTGGRWRRWMPPPSTT